MKRYILEGVPDTQAAPIAIKTEAGKVEPIYTLRFEYIDEFREKIASQVHCGPRDRVRR